MIAYTHKFIFYLFFTVLTETVIIFFIIRYLFRISSKELKTAKLIFSGIFASFSTIPYVWYIFPILIYWSYGWSLILSELSAFFIEAVFYSIFLKLNYKKSLFVSLISNSSSFFLAFFFNKHTALPSLVNFLIK